MIELSSDKKLKKSYRDFGISKFNFRQSFDAFWGMSKKAILEFSRYPIAFVTMFVQVFLIIMIFLFAGISFSPSGEESAIDEVAGVMMYGFVIFMFISFILWEIGFSIREEQSRGTLE